MPLILDANNLFTFVTVCNFAGAKGPSGESSLEVSVQVTVLVATQEAIG